MPRPKRCSGRWRFPVDAACEPREQLAHPWLRQGQECVGGAHAAHRERNDQGSRRAGRDASSLGLARRPRPYRDEVRLRNGAVRSLHGPSGRRSGPLVRPAGLRRGRPEDHDDRRFVGGRHAPRAAGVDRGGRGPVRILPVGPDHVGGGAPRPQSGPDRSGHRSGDGGQHLPLRHVPAHPRGRAQGRFPEEGRGGAGFAGDGRRPKGRSIRPMNALSRRDLLRASVLSGAGLFIAFHVPRKVALAAEDAVGKPKPLPDPNAFVRVAPDGSVTVLLAHSEMGQGIWTGLSMLVAEDLDCDWSKIKVEHAPAAPVYAHPAFGMQMTGGSSSTWAEFERYRTAGAMARAMLVNAAASKWKTDARKLRTENGFVLSGSKRISYGDLAVAAQGQKPPKSVKLKDRKDWKIIGKPTRRLDSAEKITGKAGFGMDVRFPGLRTALVARSPVFGGKVKSFDASAAKAVPGVEQVVEVPTGVAVVATNFWSAKLGRNALHVDWDLGPGASLDTTQLLADYREKAKTKGTTAIEKGDADAALAKGHKRLVAEYDVPYLAHAPMEPLNATVKI